MRSRLLIPILLLTLLLAGCAPAETSDVTEVTVYLGFRPDVQFAPFYVGLEKGFFAAEGYEVTLEHLGESDIVRLVGSGEADFGIVSGEQVLLARAQEVPIVYVWEWYDSFPVGIAAKADSGISSPADLAGRTVGVPMLEGASYIGLEAILASAGLSSADIQLEATGFTQVETLITDRVEAVVIYTTNEPVQLEAQGVDTVLLPVSDYADLVANGLIMNEARIARDPHVAQGMVDALNAALAYTIEHPDEAYSTSQSYVEGLDDPAIAVAQRAVLERSIALWSDPDRLGEIEPEAWEQMQTLLLTMGLLSAPLDLTQAYTLAFANGG